LIIRASGCALSVYRPAFFRRFEVARFFGAAARSRVNERPASFITAFCWRRISAVQKPRAAPAALFAPLSHMLSQGFFIGLSCQWQGNVPCPTAFREVRGAIRTLEEVGFLDRAIPGKGSRHKLTGTGELHRKPVLFQFGSDYAASFSRANQRAQAARERHSQGRRCISLFRAQATGRVWGS
jgi:hypothetical protein